MTVSKIIAEASKLEGRDAMAMLRAAADKASHCAAQSKLMAAYWRIADPIIDAMVYASTKDHTK